MGEPEPPETPTLDEWYESHPRPHTDSAKVTLWCPREAPQASLDVVDRGCGRSPVLPDPDHPVARLHLGPVMVVADLAELETYVAAAVEAVAATRWHAGRLAAEQQQGGGTDG